MSRWLSETGGTRGPEYDARFAALAAEGAQVHGEADFVQRLLPAGSVLDAGCGTGRVAAELTRRGYEAVGVDNDRSMLNVARRHDGTWVDADLATLDLGRTFDLVLCAGNVMVFVEPGSEQLVVDRLAAHLVPGGLLVSGWRTDRLSRTDYDILVGGLEPVERYSTWDGDAWRDDADWCVAVDRLAP
ncbi:MAG: class I SAM-dependent methyltransferase [Actinobacteria bacterium]|nr:class I SAM-dependent methyltransferase [Actinomycetota bacterium]MCA1720392.1 class I SAM-dependent methyltransferase [Actinomycetota bacterium]